MTLSSITSSHAVPSTPGLNPRRGRSGAPGPATQSDSLRRGMVIGAAAIAVAIVAVAVLVAVRTAADFLSDRADTRLRDVARRGELVTEQALLERARQVELIGASPTVVDAARQGAQRAAQMGLVGQPIEALERRMAATRSLAVSEPATRYLQSQLAPLASPRCSSPTSTASPRSRRS